MSRMSRVDRKRWAATVTLADVGEVMALWLEGEVTSWPGYAPGCGPDEETTELIPTLAALNRAGFVTISSQPGLPPTRGWDGRMWEQRAAVKGFADRCTADSLGTAAEDAGMVVIRHYTRRRLFGRYRRRVGAVPVTASGARVHTAFGGELDATEVEFILGSIGDTAMDEVLDAYQVTIIDPVWGRNDVLWPTLAGVSRRADDGTWMVLDAIGEADECAVVFATRLLPAGQPCGETITTLRGLLALGRRSR